MANTRTVSTTASVSLKTAFRKAAFLKSVLFRLFLLIGIAALPSFAFAIDTDGDGVDDSVDAFPNDAGGAIDTDNDGKPDSLLLLPPVRDSFETGAFTSVPFGWSTGGSGNWTVQASQKKDGLYSAKSPSINSWLQFTDSAAYSRTITFWSGVAVGLSATRRIRFYIDGVQQYADAGLSLTWTAKSFTVTPGTHTFEWKFDGCATTCSSYFAALDDVRITGGTVLVEDTDDDNDGVSDLQDSQPFNNQVSGVDTDADGQDNAVDADDDNDGLPDAMDPLPLQAKFNLNAPYKGSQVGDQNAVQ